MGKLILICGENNSGKSVFAEKLIGKIQGERYYIATMIPSIGENYERIERHRKQRAELNFTTLELPYILKDAPINENGVALLEDVSNLLANNIFEKGSCEESVFRDICSLKERCSIVVAVTISGLSSDGYGDETAAYINGLNTLNQKLFRIADAVVTMQDKTPVYLKGDINVVF